MTVIIINCTCSCHTQI